MFLLSSLIWSDNGRQTIYPEAVADNVPDLQVWVSEHETEEFVWNSADEIGLIRTVPKRKMGCEMLYSISQIDNVTK